FGLVDGTPQAAGFEPRVVAGGQAARAERPRPLEKRPKLDVLVAAHARVGRAPRGVLGDEIVDDVAGGGGRAGGGGGQGGGGAATEKRGGRGGAPAGRASWGGGGPQRRPPADAAVPAAS